MPDNRSLSSHDAPMSIVQLPANVPPPIAVAGTGYAVGIAGPNGFPAWANPEGVNEGHGRHRCHHHRHHRHARTSAHSGPEYLIPMGTAAPDPNGPGVIFLRPAEPRMVPYVPVQEAYANDSDELDTIRADNRHYRNQPLQIGSGDFDEFEAAEHDRDFARVRYQAEANERFRIEELERQQALGGNRMQAEDEEAKRHREWKTWALAMGINPDREDGGKPVQTHPEAYQEGERVININIRQPCKICKEPVIMETQTVHHRFPENDTSKGVGINVDGPGKLAEDDVICRRCDDELNEKKEKKELLRKVVREVIDEKSKAKKEKKDKGGTVVLHSSSSGEFAAAEGDENNQAYDREPTNKTQKLSLRHRGGNKEQAFGETSPHSVTHAHPRGHHHDAHHHERHAKTKYDDSSSSESEAEVRVTPPRHERNPKPHKREIRTPLGGVNESRYINVVEAASADVSESEQDENEAPILQRSSRSNKTARKHGSTHQSPLAASIKENPEGFVKAVLRHLDGEAYNSPKPSGKTKKGKRHADKAVTSSSSDSSSSGSEDSELDVNVNLSVKKPRKGGKHSPGVHHHRGKTKSTTPHAGRTHHRRSSSAGDDTFDCTELAKALQKSAGRHSSPHIGKEGKQGGSVAGDKQKPGFLRGWSIFQKANF
ncbi:hypothetical protein TWF696_001497 [Orbilia brochopaga]|uniref:Uncharacterized protein n=1 Tax=Orbilia brochopaga TaxID=3140254 RepID=A0AAV9U9L7_9PEZI